MGMSFGLAFEGRGLSGNSLLQDWSVRGLTIAAVLVV